MRKEHFEEQTYKTKVIDEIICNKCGKKTTLKNEFPLMHHFKTYFFYGSSYDGLTLDFDLCENCLFDFTNSFKIKVKPYDELVKWAEED